MASSIFLNPALGITSSGGAITAAFADGTSGAPSVFFTSEPTLGFWRTSAGLVTLQGNLTASASIFGTTTVRAGTLFQGNNTGAALNLNVADGTAVFQNNAATIGSRLKVDALPTVASGFGAGAAVTAGSTPLAGSIAVGTTPGSTGVITFGGTAFPSAPFVVACNTTTLQVVLASASTTQLTLTSAGFTNNDVICWMAISAK